MDFDAKYDRRAGEGAPPSAADLAGALPEFLAGRRILRAAPLAGGFVHHNLALDLSDGSTCVARVATRSRTAVETEASILRALSGRVPVPAVLDVVLDRPAGRHVIVLERVEGETLGRVEDGLDPVEVRSIARSLGEILASFHEVAFGSPGELAPGPAVGTPFDGFRNALVGYLEECLANPRLEARLGADLRRELARFVRDEAARFPDLTPDDRLVHADFNQKNVLVRPSARGWEVAAILDWEFAFSACPLADLGNFLRFEGEQPPYREPLAEAYRGAGGRLPEDWRRIARYIDLAAMTNFLCRDQAGPRTIRTAAGVVRSTLAAGS